MSTKKTPEQLMQEQLHKFRDPAYRRAFNAMPSTPEERALLGEPPGGWWASSYVPKSVRASRAMLATMRWVGEQLPRSGLVSLGVSALGLRFLVPGRNVR